MIEIRVNIQFYLLSPLIKYSSSFSFSSFMLKLSQRKAGMFNSRSFLHKNSYAKDSGVEKHANLQDSGTKNNGNEIIDDGSQFATAEGREMSGHRRQYSLNKMGQRDNPRLSSINPTQNCSPPNHQLRRAETEPIDNKQLCRLATLNPEVALPKISPNLRFPKPYLQNTKFVDLLVKNKNLLRRGQFDMPLQHEQSSKMRRSPEQTPIKTHAKLSERQQAIIRSCFLLKKEVQEERLKSSKRQKKLRVIKKTAEKCAQQYLSMLEQQQKDSIKITNSMNRILAINTIKNQISISTGSKDRRCVCMGS